MRIESLDPRTLPALPYLRHLESLINTHLAAVVPGWALPAQAIVDHLARNDGEYVIDPWVEARKTLAAVDGYRVLAAVHLLRYGDGPQVGPDYRRLGEINWVLGHPDRPQATAAVLRAAHEQLSSWGVARRASVPSLPVPVFSGVPDTWPHIATALTEAGYAPRPECGEAIYGGRLDAVPLPGQPPLPGIEVRRVAGSDGVRFVAVFEAEEVGVCECAPDLTRGGTLPAFRGWAELCEMWVEGAWRGRGVGTWLVRHAVRWLRLAGCDRIVLAVAAADEAAGAGRFYERFGWDVLVRELRAWHPAAAEPAA